MLINVEPELWTDVLDALNEYQKVMSMAVAEANKSVQAADMIVGLEMLGRVGGENLLKSKREYLENRPLILDEIQQRQRIVERIGEFIRTHDPRWNLDSTEVK